MSKKFMIENSNISANINAKSPQAFSLEDCMFDMFSPDSNISGDAFFDKSIAMLNDFIGADYSFISVLDNEKHSLETIAVFNLNSTQSNYSYKLRNTPCAEVIKNVCVSINSDGKVAYPEDKRFTDFDLNSYIGVPLYNSKKEVVGVLGSFFKEALPKSKRVVSLMYMFSARIGSEIDHQNRERELKRRNLELLVYEEELLRKNKELDAINRELKIVSIKADESNKLKSSFLANLSHEIRTPMNAVIGFTELLRSNNVSEEEKKDYLSIVYQNGNQLMRVMDALIDISKLQSRSLIDSKENLSVNEILNAIYNQYTEEISIVKKPISLQIECERVDGEDDLLTYKEALIKVLDHIVENALKFTDSGVIKIGYTVVDNSYEFYVEDTGVGIDKGEEENIFDLFRQGDLNTTREFGGTGIGLSIVSKYLEMMEGNVWAEKDREVGAMFRFKIPITKMQP